MSEASRQVERPRARLFFALDLSERERRRITAWRDAALEGVEGLRYVAAESLHVTLAFLGARPEDEVDAIARVGLESVGGLQAPVVLPREIAAVPRRRPRLYALDLEDAGAGAGAVHLALTTALAAAGLHRPEARPFWPHVTLARVRGARRSGPPLPEKPTSLEPSTHEQELQLTRMTLYRSHLSSAGARYEPLAVRELERRA